MDTAECTQKTTDQEIPGVLPRRLRDREQLRKRKLEAQEKKTSQEESKSKCGRKGKASGTSRKHTKNPEPETEPEPGPDPGPPQEVKEDVKDKPVHPDPENERPALLVESAKLSITEETATTSTDDAGETKSPGIEIPETLQLQAEDVPRENAPFEEQMFLYF
uniref:hemogen isoform X3 n=1 Tax=Pristiophorus japonicus TaxID=55135 RepID=UPI00398F25EC